jgi:N-glycosylase/DNA lyase
VFHKELNRTARGNTASFVRLSPGLLRILRSTYTLAAIRGGKPFPVIGGVSLPIRKHNERHIMKRLIALTLVTLGITVSARAQWVVFDPTAQIQSIINTAQEVAQFVTMIQNQVQQIQSLTDQLNEFKNYESLFGDPKAVVLATVQPLVTDLQRIVAECSDEQSVAFHVDGRMVKPSFDTG